MPDLTPLWEMSRDLNRIFAPIAFTWLSYRTVRAWPAEWAKPHHVWHYRAVLVIAAGFLLVATWSAYLYAAMGTTPTAISGARLVLVVAALALCARWPKPRALRRDASCPD